MSISRPPSHIPTSNVILLLVPDDERSKLIRGALSTSGYQVIEAFDRRHAETLLRESEDRVNLICACVYSDSEAAELRRWNNLHDSIPLLIFRMNQSDASTLLEAEIALRTRLALEAALPSRSVLLVDDNEAELKGIAGLLDAAGYRVRQAISGKAALALLAQGTYDVVLTELFMAEMDGLELIQRIRKTYPDLAIVAISEKGYLNVARMMGAKGTLVKPLAVDSLLQIVRQASERSFVGRRSRAD